MFLTAQKVGAVVEKEYKGESLTITLQDGPMAGQTVPHVHVHIIPRVKGDWANNDEIYPEIDKKEREMNAELSKGAKDKKGVDNDERKPRSLEEMTVEATGLRPHFEQFEDVWSA
ncbi:HIT-like domain-containing protein [Fimicolochytrium jonesii]|uniref:HIT-like domain-containing protein n=1 Tax=Fimicolochytrium jonesii TaxID=1396493 RepID=UPI0022FF4507|nr:HIT-like domain-containing protein [Fimicolochytrium jonesii]KAI8821676.1 HIT-like domain-containing protein [Fimicolochytrium jonesii]